MAEKRLGRYRLDRLLGRGGMGQVWLAVDTTTDRRVALKVLPGELAEDRTYRARFEREAELAARLRDPHIVPIRSHGELDGRLFIEMEYIDGIDLARLLHRDGPLPPARAVDIVAQTAAALDAAHRAGLVHRDVKPPNILVRPDGFVYLIDFGIAHGSDSTALTTAGLAIGTWAYMAPERFTGRTDARSDVYSLGCVLYECLAGARPFGDTDPAQQMHAHLSSPPPSVHAANPAVPAELDRVIARAMAKDLTARYATAGELARAAAAALPTLGTDSPAPTRVYELPDHPDAAPTGAALPETHPYTTAEAEHRPALRPTAHLRASEYPPTMAYTRLATEQPAERYHPVAYAPARRPGPSAGYRPTPAAPGQRRVVFGGRTPRSRSAGPPRRRRRTLRTVLLLLALIGVPLVLIGGCVAALVDWSGGVMVRVGATDPQQPIAVAPGAPVRDGKLEFTVTNTETAVQTVGIERADGEFVVVSLTVTNIGTEQHTYLPLGQELFDTAGRRYTADITATAQRAAAAAGPRNLQPGESFATHLVFGVPKQTVPDHLLVRDFPLSLGTPVPLP
ncbi:serine/threonine-protein kinase [Nocardia paucivorans]|uniref:serine/threonine-protein kinase n=1 Tax=Nocardia paucivorans TaxID=114259 RepID=UPI0002DF88F5|nr:serine/threonine-protein kinase [Nocardia paucivorans]